MAKDTHYQERFSAYVVIPAPVFFDPNLPERAKMLYGLISSMCNHAGYCWAKNATLARYLGATEDKTVRRHLSVLKDRGYISVAQENEGGVTIRKIYITDIEAVRNRPVISDRPPGHFCPERPVISDRQNNINNNNIPPIAPLEGADASAVSKSHSKKSRPRQKAGEPVDLPPEQEQRFKTFWEAFPVHKDKQRARLRWAQIAPSEELTTEIIEAVSRLKKTDDWSRGVVPLPSTFLYNRRWEDAEDLPESSEMNGGLERW